VNTRIARHLIVAGLAALLAIPVMPSGVAMADPLPTTTDVMSSGSPSDIGQSVTFTATVLPADATTGTVAFTDGGVAIGLGTFAGSGLWTLATTSLTIGSHQITATYSGDSTYAPSWATVTQVVNALPTSTNLVSSGSPSVFGQSVTFDATVVGSPGPPTGTVTFMDGSATLGTGGLTGGTATFSSSNLNVVGSPHQVTAVYGGDSTYAPSTSLAVSQTVTKGSQTVSFTSTAPGAATVGGATYTPTATATSGLTVVLTIDSSAAAVCSISGGVVSFTAAGTCLIDANQSGDTNYSAATQVQQSFAVGKGSQTITIGALPTGVAIGSQGKVVSAAATSGLAVTYSSQTTAICAVNSTTGALSLLTTGLCTIAADQAGNGNWNAAAQVTVSFAVAPPFTVPILTVTADSQSRPFGTPNPALTATISGFVAGQTLATSGVSGTPACTTTATIFSPAGTYPITCTIGTLVSGFYSFSFVDGTLTIVHGASSVTLSTTTTVFETSTPVTWTAAVEPGVSGATPTGSLVFTIDGVARPAVPLDANGRGSVTVTWPTPGAKSVQVSYAGDASFAASGTASAAPSVVANTARATGVGVSASSFYPIVDGWLDTVTARGTRLEPLGVAISVKNASGSSVRTFSAPIASGPYSWNWNGRTASGTALPAGTYTIVQTLTDPYGSHPRIVKTSKVVLSLRKISWSTVTVAARPGPRCFQFTTADGVGTYSCSSTGAASLAGDAGHWPGVGYQFQLPSGAGYRTIRVEVLGTYSGGRPTIGLHDWALGSTWGQLYRQGWRRTAISPTTTSWAGVTFAPGSFVAGRSVRVYVDGGGRLAGAFSFAVKGIRLVVSVGTFQ
jgi:hypothetical protein